MCRTYEEFPTHCVGNFYFFQFSTRKCITSYVPRTRGTVGSFFMLANKASDVVRYISVTVRTRGTLLCITHWAPCVGKGRGS